MNPFQLISSREIYTNPWISVREDSVIRPGGTEGIFGVVSVNHGSHTVAIDARGYMAINREYCYGLGTHTYRLPGGGISIGESPLEAAQKELREEAGISAIEWIDLGVLYPLTTVLENIQYVFLAQNISHTSQDTEDGEIIESMMIPFSTAVEWAMNGTIGDASSVIAILRAHIYLNNQL